MWIRPHRSAAGILVHRCATARPSAAPGGRRVSIVSRPWRRHISPTARVCKASRPTAPVRSMTAAMCSTCGPSSMRLGPIPTTAMHGSWDYPFRMRSREIVRSKWLLGILPLWAGLAQAATTEVCYRETSTLFQYHLFVTTTVDPQYATVFGRAKVRDALPGQLCYLNPLYGAKLQGFDESPRDVI